MLHRKQFPLPVFIRKQDFSVKNAVAVAIGIAVKGTASVYAIELKDMAPEEIRKITVGFAKDAGGEWLIFCKTAHLNLPEGGS